MQNEIYSRQEKLQLKMPQAATIIGCGGTGFWTALFLAMSGVEHLILIDNDVIEKSNLNRLPLSADKTGSSKVEILRDFIKACRPLARIECHKKRVEKSIDCQILRGTVLCCTDNLKSQQLICAYCKKNNLSYQRIGYDGVVLNVSKAFPLSFKEQENEDGYTITPSWVVPAVVAAGLGVFSRLYNELSVMDSLGKLNIVSCSYIPEEIKDNLKEEGKEDILDNIYDHIPDSYGCCEDCNRCEDCDRINPDDEDYGYCPQCSRITEEDLEDEKKTAHDEGYEEGFHYAMEVLRKKNC